MCIHQQEKEPRLRRRMLRPLERPVLGKVIVSPWGDLDRSLDTYLTTGG